MRAARAWHLLTAAVALAALVLQVVLVIRGGRVLEEVRPPSMPVRVLRFVAYFTVQSNVLVLVSAATLARDPEHAGRRFGVVRTAAMTGIVVTGLVHWLLLRPLLHLHGADLVADKLLHLVVPVLALVGWLVFGPRPRMSRRTSLRATLWPVAWLVVILAEGVATGWYPYPFLDHREHGWDHVAVVCAGILVLWFALLYAGRAWDRRMAPAPRPATGLAEVTGS
ncbi:MAG TPA: Pr6Pr family membrane protein [Nocardioides sp.]|uniref:Pr6Pr family membrane protein n=1 Tax=Nocardioides sp. TaxID=35761 RepID=UPI002F3F2745